MDTFIFRLINNAGAGIWILDALKVFCAVYLPYLVVLFMIILLLRKSSDKNTKRMVVISLVAATFARFGVKSLILHFYDRPRPFVILPDVHQLTTVPLYEYYQSFPSGHAIFFFALSACVYFFNKKLGMWLTVASIIIGIGRVFVGVHWPSDILAAFVLGTATAYVFHRLFSR